jgi:hypothetical protein
MSLFSIYESLNSIFEEIFYKAWLFIVLLIGSSEIEEKRHKFREIKVNPIAWLDLTED